MPRSSPPCSARGGMAACAARLIGGPWRPQIADPRRPLIYSRGGSKHAEAADLRRPSMAPSTPITALRSLEETSTSTSTTPSSRRRASSTCRHWLPKLHCYCSCRVNDYTCAM